MKKFTLFRRLCAVTMGLLLGTAWAMAQISVPSVSNTDYVDFTSATLSNVKLDGGYNNQFGVGSMKNSEASITLPGITNEVEKQYVLAFKARYNTNNTKVTVQIKFTDGASNEYSTEILTIDNNNCTRGTDSYYMLQLTNPLPVGTYTLDVNLTSTAGTANWGANFGNLLVLDPDNFNGLASEKIDFNKYTDKSTQGGVEAGFGNSDANYKYGIGSFKSGSYIKVPLINTTQQDYVLTYLWKVGNSDATNLNITITKGDNTIAFNQDFAIYNTNDAWRTAAANITNLATGIYTMTITASASQPGSWCPNVSNLAIVPKSNYVAYDSRLLKTIDLSKGLKTGNINIATNKIDATRNGATAVYIVNCKEEGTYDFSFQGAASSGHPNSKVTAQVCDAAGNLIGDETEFSITPSVEDIWTDFSTYTISGVELKEGLNIVRLAFATSTGFCANLQNLDFTKTSPINTIPSTSFAMDLGVRADRTNTQFKSSTLVDANQRDSYFIYRANVTKAGKYILSIGSYCDQTNEKQPSFTVLVTDAEGKETTQTFTITNPGTKETPVDETFTTEPIDLPVGICTIKISFASATNNTWTTNLKDMKVYSYLDEETEYTPEDTETNVKMARTMTANKWSTFVAPFAMTTEQVKTAFGSEAKVAKLNGIDGTTLKFNTVTETEANVPVMVYPSQDVTSITADGVTIVAGTPEQSVSGIDFIGNYGGSLNIPEGAYFVSNNKLYRASDATNTIKNFRGYFTTTSSNARLSAFVIDNETTGIEENYEVGNMNSDNSVYDLQGRKVKNPAKGLYIVNGKKFVVK